MGAPILIGTLPTKISAAASRPYLLANSSSSVSTVYVGQSSNVSSYTYAITLAPGAVITWTDITSDVWAVCLSGSASVTVAYEASGVFSPTTAGANPTLLKTLAIPFATTDTTITGSLTDVPISSYNSVILMVSVNITTPFATLNGISAASTVSQPLSFAVNSSGGTFQSTNAFINISGVQYDAAFAGQSGSFAKTTSALFSFGDGVGTTTGLLPAIQTYQFPVNNGMFSADINAYKAITGANSGSGTITIRMYGSQQQISLPIYKNWPIPNQVRYFDSGGIWRLLNVTSNPASNLEILTPTLNNNALLTNIGHNPGSTATIVVAPNTAGSGNLYQYSYINSTTLTQSAISLTTTTISGTNYLTSPTLGNNPIAFFASVGLVNTVLTVTG